MALAERAWWTAWIPRPKEIKANAKGAVDPRSGIHGSFR